MLGTPLATASLPVRPTAPDANARSTSRIESAWRPSGGNGCGAVAAGAASPVATRHSPYTMSAPIETTYTYVGPANTIPASRMPRRFPIMRMPMNASPMSTRCS